tara:strand:+ start:834 stop:950 length:117 start_codon:yes stop_codon:yes gene_type:complete
MNDERRTAVFDLQIAEKCLIDAIDSLRKAINVVNSRDP